MAYAIIHEHKTGEMLGINWHDFGHSGVLQRHDGDMMWTALMMMLLASNQKPDMFG